MDLSSQSSVVESTLQLAQQMAQQSAIQSIMPTARPSAPPSAQASRLSSQLEAESVLPLPSNLIVAPPYSHPRSEATSPVFNPDEEIRGVDLSYLLPSSSSSFSSTIRPVPSPRSSSASIIPSSSLPSSALPSG